MEKVKVELYQKVRASNPEFIAAMESLGQAVMKAGPLDERSGQLIQLAAAAAIRSEGAVHSHTRRALAVGATSGEIRQTLILLTSTIGFPSVMAAMSWAEDILSAPR